MVRGAAQIVELENISRQPAGVVDPGIRVQVGVAEVLKRPAVKLIGAASRHDADSHGGCSGTAQIELRCLDSHLRDVLDAWLHHGRAVVETAAAEAIADSGSAVEIGAHHRAAWQVVPSASRASDAARARPARNQKRQAHYVAVQHRKIDDLFGIDGVGQHTRIGFHQRRRAFGAVRSAFSCRLTAINAL